MNYGRFFVLDIEDSDISNGIAVFNYRGVKYTKNDGRCEYEKDTPKYPFYVTITPKGVFFHMHYAIMAKGAKGELQERIIHKNSLILALPTSIGSEVKDNLTERIDGVFSASFPFNHMNGGNNDFIYKLVIETTKSSEVQKKGVSYSSLEVFGIDYDKIEEANINESRFQIKCFLRKMFLDFIFDLEHSTTFENAANYDEVRHKLYNNFLFNAISNKAEYYYQRKRQTQAVTTSYPWEEAAGKLFYADYYTNAEQRWVDIIVNPQAEESFFNSGWFTSVEKEMDEVYTSGRLKYKLPQERNRVQKKIASAKSTKCANEFLADIETKNEKVLEEQKQSLQSRVKTSARVASNWYIKKYNFAGTSRIWQGKASKWVMYIMLALLVSLCATFILPSIDRDCIGDQVLTPLYILGGGAIIWCFNYLLSRRKYIRRVGFINTLMPRLFASILAAWFTLAIGEDIFKGFFDSGQNWYVSIPLLIILVVFVYYEIGKINTCLTWWPRLRRSLTLLLIAFSYAYMCGVIVIHFFGGKYLERSDYIDEFYVNRVFPADPDFIVAPGDQYKVVHEIFYNTVGLYGDNILNNAKELSKNETLKEKISGLILSKETLQPKVSRRCFDGDIVVDSIDYRITMILANKFSEDKDVNHLELLYERLFEGNTIQSRLSRVEVLCDRLLAEDYSALDCNITGEMYRNTWLKLIKSIDKHTVYRDLLEHLEPNKKKYHVEILDRTKLSILIFRDLLLQFTFFAMFIGIFIQLIFEEKAITEPV